MNTKLSILIWGIILSLLITVLFFPVFLFAETEILKSDEKLEAESEALKDIYLERTGYGCDNKPRAVINFEVMKEGDEIEDLLNLSLRENKGRYYTQADAWSIKGDALSNEPSATQEDEDQDVPF